MIYSLYSKYTIILCRKLNKINNLRNRRFGAKMSCFEADFHADFTAHHPHLCRHFRPHFGPVV